MGLNLCAVTDVGQWNQFVNASPQGNVFCRTEFLKGLGEEYGLWFVMEDNEPLLGAVMLLRDQQPLPLPYPHTHYQGVLYSSAVAALPIHRRVKLELTLVDYLLAELAKSFHRLAFYTSPRLTDLRSFSWFHYHDLAQGRFQIDLRYTALLDLTAQSFEGYLGAIRENRRRDYNKAQRLGFTVEPSDDTGALERLYELTLARQGLTRKPDGSRLIQALARTTLQHDLGELLLCRDSEGALASATLFLWDQHCAYHLFSANDPQFRELGSATFLMIQNIQRAQQRGIPSVDFLGINSPQRGDFKTSLNGQPAPYYLLTWERP